MLYFIKFKDCHRSYLAAGATLLFSLCLQHPMQAQIIPDRTLLNNSLVTPNSNNVRIDGGTRAGSNLFHSFREFSVPTGSTAFFNNAVDIQNILSRVTGGNVSNIDGLIRANGGANLFLINPAGIIFGPNARLDIGGSFIGSTANSLQFEDGSFFSATDPQAPPLLTINIPRGLEFRGNPQPIQVQGKGSDHLSVPDPIFLPWVGASGSLTGLRVRPGNTIALVGGDIALEGANLTAPQGRIELGSIGSGLVNLNPVPTGWTFGYEGVPTFQDIRLSQQASVDASGFGSGSIQVRGDRVRVSDGSVILIENQGVTPSGSIRVNASDSLEVIGISPNIRTNSGLVTQTVANGRGGDIEVSARQVLLAGGSRIESMSAGEGTSGSVRVEAAELIDIGEGSIAPFAFSSIRSVTFDAGNGGDVNLSTQRLTVRDGGISLSFTSGSGNGGNLNVDATDIEIMGVSSIFEESPTGLSTVTVLTGVGGTLTINTSRLRVLEGGSINSDAIATGSAGNIIINASEFVEVRGGSNSNTNIQASARVFDLADVDSEIPLPPLNGFSGSVVINTPRLRIANEGEVSVRNEGMGDAGNLTINARSIFLNREGSLTASSESGEGGNISLENVRVLRMRRNSEISAEARGGKGSGGNIIFDADIIVGLEDSDINANAFGGNGGNINIRTQGIFGSEFRQEDTSKSDITASSEFGVDGTVQINDPDVEPNEGLIDLPENVVDAASIIAKDACAQAVGSEFFITGKGGLPRHPNESLDSEEVMVSLVNSAPSQIGELKENTEIYSGSEERQIIPARGWIFKENGEVVLIGYDPNSTDSQRGYNLTHGCNFSTEVMGEGDR